MVQIYNIQVRLSTEASASLWHTLSFLDLQIFKDIYWNHPQRQNVQKCSLLQADVENQNESVKSGGWEEPQQ